MPKMPVLPAAANDVKWMETLSGDLRQPLHTEKPAEHLTEATAQKERG